MDPEIKPEETLPVDDFADAFESLTREPAIVPPADETLPPVVETPPAVDETLPPVVETPPAVDETLPTVVETAEQLRIHELEAQLEAAKAPPAPAPAVEPPPAAPTPTYTDEEKGLIDKYHDDWPDIAKAEALKRRQEYRDIVSYVFSQVQEMVAPALQYVETNSSRTAYSDIVDLVPDYDVVRDKAVEWAQANTQPAYLKAAFGRVITEGTPEEVADLITRFKKETGYAAPVVAPPAVVPAAVGAVKPSAPLSGAAIKAAGTLKVVKTSRSVQSESADPNDFNAAFSEAVGHK